MANPSSKGYPANRGEIASPATPIVKSLDRATGNSLPVRHNQHPLSNPSGRSVISGPATEGIVKGGLKETKVGDKKP